MSDLEQMVPVCAWRGTAEFHYETTCGNKTPNGIERASCPFCHKPAILVSGFRLALNSRETP